MIPSRFDLNEFAGHLPGSDYHDCLLKIEKEATEAERLIYRPGVAEEERHAAGCYAKRLIDLIFIMRYDARPPGLTHEEYLSLKATAGAITEHARRSRQAFGFSKNSAAHEVGYEVGARQL